MNNDQQDHHNPRLPFSHGFNLGTTLQHVFRNINQAFATTHDSAGEEMGVDTSRDRLDDMPSLEPTDPVVARPGPSSDMDAVSASTSAVPGGSTSTEPTMPPHIPQPSLRDDDDDSMPDLRSVTDTSDESDVEVGGSSAILPPQDSQLIDDDNNSDWTDDEPPPLDPIAGSRRARVHDDVDDARDRRHPSERIGSRPPQEDAAPQPSNPQQPERPPNNDRLQGIFAPLFGLNPLGGGNAPAREDGSNEHTHTHAHGEGIADPSPANNDPFPGDAPRVLPAVGFTFTIPLFGPTNGNRTGAAGAPQPGLFGVDTTTREELLASFAAFFQDLQALDGAREDPERAKKLVAGLEVIPLGLVKRLERVGGAPGGHVGDSSAEGSSSGCAICWDTLLDSESDGFGAGHVSGDETSQSLPSQNVISSDNDTMDVDSSSAPLSHLSEETSTSPPSEEPRIISLPCAHVFHASCLLPWFTRAKQATCPTCRFNIDPENLTYTPPSRRAPPRPPAQPDNVPNPAPAQPQAPADVPEGAPAMEVNPVDADVPPNPQPAPADARPEPAARPRAFPGGRHGPAMGFAIPLMTFPAIQIPLRPNDEGGGDQGVDVVTIGLDMFIGGPPPGVPGEQGPRGDDANAAANPNPDRDADGEAGQDGAEDANMPPVDIQAVLEGLLRATRHFFNPQGPEGPAGPAPAPPADGPQAGAEPAPVPDAAGAPPAPPANGPRIIPLPPNMFRPTRSMPPRRKTWTLPPAPGPSLRQHVEQREREQGLRCSDTSCGIGPSDEDPCPEVSPSLTKQVSIHPHPSPDHESDIDAAVCAHMFHPACLVSAERVADWGGEDKTEPFVEVSCPVCRAVGCVTRDEWEAGVSTL